MSGNNAMMKDTVVYQVEVDTYGLEKAFAIIEQMTADGAVCLYESPRKAECCPASKIPTTPEERTKWWLECTSCTVSHAGAELRLEKPPFTLEATGRLFQELPQQEQGDVADGKVETALVRLTSYVLRQQANVRDKGKLAYKEYFKPNEHGMLQCYHTRTAGLVRG